MISSMTAFAYRTGTSRQVTWSVEMRGGNGKGLDSKLRLPKMLSSHERVIRKKLASRVSRGSINLTIRVDEERTRSAFELDQEALACYLEAVSQTNEAAARRGIALSPVTAVDLLGLRGVLAAGFGDTMVCASEILSTVDEVLDAFCQMRSAEGGVLDEVLRGHLEQIRALVAQAARLAQLRKKDMARIVQKNLATILDNSEGISPERVAQELALLVIKSDISEEVDRLDAHVQAVEALLDGEGAVGRKLDFLMQELNREANTLCSKSGSADLTAVGLDLKAIIDQMREQVQNVE